MSIVSFNAISQQIGDHIEIGAAQLEWESQEGLSRVWINQHYYFIDANRNVILDLSAFAFVEDFSEGVAIVKSQTGLYGAINKVGKLIIDTKWSNATACTAGYISVASNIGNFVNEDRGEGGVKAYTEVEWQLLEVSSGNIIPFGFRQIMNISGIIRSEDMYGHQLKIDTSRINMWYYHPLMKAIKEIDNRPVAYQISADKQFVEYHYADQTLALKLKIEHARS